MSARPQVRIRCRYHDHESSYDLEPANVHGVGGNYVWTVKPESLSPRDPRALDLLEIARATHLADRAFRRSTRLGQRRRRIHVRVAVSDPESWAGHASALADLAGFASQDEWRFDFSRSRAKAPRPRATEIEGAPSIVALFSGGLDSLCGAAHLARRDERPLFVSHSPPGRELIVNLVGDLWSALAKEGPGPERCVTCRLRVVERDARGTRSMFQEPTRRTRPFYFLALAAAMAVELGTPRVQMSENGAMALSLPMRADAHGAVRARQAHSALLEGFRDLLERLAPERGPWSVENPLERETKGEACARLKAARGADALAARSVSCEYVGRQAAVLRSWKSKNPGAARELGDGPQCGLCEPCLCRRAALARAGIADPDDGYFFDARAVERWLASPSGTLLAGDARSRPPLLESAAPHVFFMRRFCERLSSLDRLAFGVNYLPELRRPYSKKRFEPRELKRTFELMRRFATEVLAFLDS